MAEKRSEWHEQWSLFSDEEQFLLEEAIAPVKLTDLSGQDVLECGCGGGHHTSFAAPYARSITAVDLNTIDIARDRYPDLSNVTFLQADIASLNLGRQFDAVLCIGVIHHTDDPDATFRNMLAHCKPGGRMIIWTYSAEGNALVRYGVEPLRTFLLRHLSRRHLAWVARAMTSTLYPFVYTIYRIPGLHFLPYFEYFRNFRRLSFERNLLNVFDKLNAPQTQFTTSAKCREWFNEETFEPSSISIRRHVGVSYSLSGIKRR